MLVCIMEMYVSTLTSRAFFVNLTSNSTVEYSVADAPAPAPRCETSTASCHRSFFASFVTSIPIFRRPRDAEKGRGKRPQSDRDREVVSKRGCSLQYEVDIRARKHGCPLRMHACCFILFSCVGYEQRMNHISTAHDGSRGTSCMLCVARPPCALSSTLLSLFFEVLRYSNHPLDYRSRRALRAQQDSVRAVVWLGLQPLEGTNMTDLWQGAFFEVRMTHPPRLASHSPFFRSHCVPRPVKHHPMLCNLAQCLSQVDLKRLLIHGGVGSGATIILLLDTLPEHVQTSGYDGTT